MSRVCVPALALLLAFSGFSARQDAMSAQPPPATPQAGNTERPPATPPAVENTTGQTASDGDSPQREEHVIYVPFEKLRDVLEDEDSSIVLPYGQFLEMWDRLVQPVQPPVKPPVNGVITHADYVGTVKGELVHLEATLDVEVLGAEWARLPVQFGDAAIGSARAEDEAVLLRGVGQGQYELLVHGEGKHRIKLSLMTAVKSATEGRSFTVECPAVGVSNLELVIPEKDLAVQVDPQRALELRPGEKDATLVRAVLGAATRFTVSWQPKTGGADQAAGLANVTDTIAVDVGDGVVHTHALFDYQILRGSLGELTIELPADQRLLDVQSRGLRDWQTETIDDRQQVKVRLHAPASDTIRLELRTEMPLPDEAFRVGQVRAVGAARESGVLAVRSAEDVGLEYVERESITRIDAADAPETLRKVGGTFYKFFRPDHTLSLVASPLQPRIIVDSHLSVLLDKARVTTRGQFRCEVSRSGIFSLALRLPGAFQVDEVRADSMERFEVASAKDGQTLTVYFTKKLLGEFAIHVTASQARDKPAGELALPLLEPLNATREQGLVAVIARESLEVKTDASQLEAARSATPEELASRGFQPQPPAGSTLAAAFSFVTRPVRIVQAITERPRRMLVLVGTVAHVKEDVVQVVTSLDYQIQFAGTDTFRLAVPAAASDRLQIEGDGIKERRKAGEASDDGTVEWTIVLHSEALGRVALTATYDEKISIPERGTQFELKPIRALDADRETGEIAVHKDRALSIESAATGLEEIDPRELSQHSGATQPYLAYRYYQHPAGLTLSVTKHELQDVVRTIVRRAYIEAVVTEDGPVTVRARYDLKSSERQRLAVRLRSPRILGVSVAGQTVAPEKAPATAAGDSEDKAYFINVARAADSDEPFEIALVYEMPPGDEGLNTSGELHLPLPQFEEGVKFQKVYVRLWVPQDYRLVGDPGGYTSHIGVGLWDSRAINQAADNPDGWFTEDASSFDFQVGGTTYLFSSLTGPRELTTGYWHIPTMTTLGSLLVLAIGIGLTRFSLETKVFWVLVMVFALLFVGLFRPSPVYSWLLAARLGIAGVVAIWLVAWLLYARRTAIAASTPFAELATPLPAEVVAAGKSPFGDSPAADRPEEATGKAEGGGDDNR
ncbi:MAG: hypothetical protein GXY83_42600 [Rhodopirellula sp.]|nr:hypothetical protein [Rhodopirellula sp.]